MVDTISINHFRESTHIRRQFFPSRVYSSKYNYAFVFIALNESLLYLKKCRASNVNRIQNLRLEVINSLEAPKIKSTSIGNSMSYSKISSIEFFSQREF